MITKLKDNQVFVFGSNLAGNHAAGAAKQAKEDFGAEDGIGVGLTGQCYAFPTLNKDMRKRHLEDLNTSRDRLYATCRALPEKEFLLTKVGCGIAGYTESEIVSLFSTPPMNLVLPEDWL